MRYSNIYTGEVIHVTSLLEGGVWELIPEDSVINHEEVTEEITGDAAGETRKKIKKVKKKGK